MIVFTSDRGECAGAHGFNQKTVFYEESARVPLIVSFKGRTHSGTSDRLVNTGLDILPTVLDFAGIPQAKKIDAGAQSAAARFGRVREAPGAIMWWRKITWCKGCAIGDLLSNKLKAAWSAANATNIVFTLTA